MFRCDLSGANSIHREQPVRILIERPIEHPARIGTYVDEYGFEHEYVIDPGGYGTTIVRELRVRECELRRFEESTGMPITMNEQWMKVNFPTATKVRVL